MLDHFRRAFALIVITFSTGLIYPAAAEPLRVVASFSIVADLARNVGAERVEIETIVGADGDAHVYEPRPADAAAMAKADVVLVNGLHFEGFLQRLVAASDTEATIVELAAGIETISTDPHAGHEAIDDGHPHEHDHEQGHEHGPVDPHAFHSVPNVEIYVKNIADAFCTADATGCTAYRANAAAYTRELKALDGEIRAAIASIPADRRLVIATHDAFGHFEHEYGLAFRAPQGISTDAEPSAADVARLIEQIKQDKAAAIFAENITNPRLIERIAAETGIKVGGTLYSDALSGPDGPAGTYIDMMRHNIEQIKGAILGS